MPSPLAEEGEVPPRPSLRQRSLFRFRTLLALAALLAGTLTLSAQPAVDDSPKKLDSKAEPPKGKDAKPLVLKLPDGTFLWLGGAGNGERVTLTPQEFQKLLDRVDALKKELAARKPIPPSGCAIRGRVEKRGEQLVAALKLTYSFRTSQANSAVSLGGRRSFLVSATLDGAKLPVLDTGEEGFAVMVESAGEHAVVLDVEVPVTARGTKAEVGFDMGLPRAPITTLALDAPANDVKRINLTTRTPDPAQPAKAPESRRLVGVDVKQLVAKGGHAGLPLGPVDSLEVTWDPPAAAAQPAAVAQSAELDVSVVFTEGFIESTAKVKLRGPGRDWKFVAPATADVSVDRVASGTTETGPTQQPVVVKPGDPAKLVWKIELPLGSSASDWTVTAVVRQPRPKSGPEPAPLPVGPFAVLDALRQTGTVKVTAGPHTRFVFKHGPDLRRTEPPGPAEEDNSTAFFRLATGPTGQTAVDAPLLTIEAWPVEGTVRVKPTYKLQLTDAGSWQIRAEIAVKPIRTEVAAVTIKVPAAWRGLESESNPEVVEGVTQGKVEGLWRPITVQLASGLKRPFDIVLVGTLPVSPGGREAVVALPRYPKVVERDAAVTATVPEGYEVHGSTRMWDGDQPAAWGTPLSALPGIDGKAPKAITTVTGRGALGLAEVSLAWQPYRPDVTAEVRADVTLGERQVVVSQVIKLRSADGFPRSVRFHGPANAYGLKALPALSSPSAGAWSFSPRADAREATLSVSFALPLPERSDGPLSLPVGLIWPGEAIHAEATVRVWVNSVAGRAVAVSSPGWRELPPEVIPERAALPALTLAASGEYPLVLDVRGSAPSSVATIRVERALVEAGMTEDGSVSYRARFRLQLYLISTVELLLPDAAGPNPTARVDGSLAALVPVSENEGRRRFRVTLPEGPSRGAVLEVNYTLPGSRSLFGDTTYQPPQLASAAYTAPVRWLITEPVDSSPLLFSKRGHAEMRWRARGITYAPSAATRAALERWLMVGAEPAADDVAPAAEGELLVVRQTAPEAVRVVRVPWLALVIGCSLAVALVIIALTWLPAALAAILVALLAGAFGVGVALYPQPASQLLAAAQPGFGLGLFAIALQAAVRWQVRRRVTHLPGFTRSLPEPSAVAPAVPPAPSGGKPAGSAPSATRSRGSSSPPATAPSGS